jgi:hypothetical protein
MRRKGESDALKSVNEARWLVVRNRLSYVVSCLALTPKADLRAAMSAERNRWVAEGWHAEASLRHCAFFFLRSGRGARACRDRVLRAGVAQSDRMAARMVSAELNEGSRSLAPGSSGDPP